MIKDKNFTSRLSSLVLPIAFQQLMLALISATDAVMLGLVDQTALSAVSLAGQVQFVFSMFIAASADGSGILIAQYWGKGDRTSVDAVAPLSLRINLPVGLICTGLALAVPELLMQCFTSDAALIRAGADYLRAVSASYLLFAVSQVYLGLLKNIGRARESSRISSAAVIVNIVLNALLIFGLLGFPALGIAGAAYATVLSRLLELALSVLWCAKEQVCVNWPGIFAKNKLLLKDFRHNFRVFFGAAIVWGLGSTMYSVILGHMGSDAVAANSIASVMRTMIFCFCRGLGIGTAVLVGNVLGSGDMALAKTYGDRLSGLSVLFGAASAWPWGYSPR